MGTESNRQWKLRVDADSINRLQIMSDALGSSLSANEIAAAAVFEVSRIAPEHLWTVLGGIRQYAKPELIVSAQSQKRLKPVKKNAVKDLTPI